MVWVVVEGCGVVYVILVAVVVGWWCMNVDWIVMVCGGGGGDGSDVCVIRVVILGMVG